MALAVVSCAKGDDTLEQPLPPVGKVYSVGDAYVGYGVSGIVCKVDPGGRSGLMISRSYVDGTKWSTQEAIVGAHFFDGEDNRRVIESIDNWATLYPIYERADYWFSRCWYIPSADELLSIINTPSTLRKVNDAYRAFGLAPLSGGVMSSTESPYDGKVQVVDMSTGKTRNVAKSNSSYKFYTVAKFPASQVHTDEIYYRAYGEKVAPSAGDFGVTIVKNIFDSVNGIGSIIFDGNITYIPDEAFKGQDRALQVKIPISVKTIGREAFAEMSLIDMEISEYVESIGDYAFAGCARLEKFTCMGERPPKLSAASHLFDDCHENLIIRVPHAAVEAYRKAPGWSAYAEIIKGF
jgi:hypothetical protein